METTSTSLRAPWRRPALGAATLALALSLAGCSLSTTQFVPGTASSGAAGTAGSASSTPKAATCAPNGAAIPDGHYAGTIKATIVTTMSITTGGISIPNAGGGTEAWSGTVDVVSKRGKVTGTIAMTELGLSQVGTTGGVQVHSVDDSELSGTIAGTSDAPSVVATGTGEWASLDAPVLNGSGTSTSTLTGGLHVTRADCTSISGDAVAMFSDFMAPVAHYLTVSGSGAWVAKRK